MPCIPRVVIPGIPHHIVQRGNRRQRVFFCDEDRAHYLKLLKKYGEELGLSFWAYCLMPNHVHLVGIPKTEKSLSEFMAVVHRRYALRINLREEWRGCLWQGRFYSCPLDNPHTLASARYIERNPVRAGLVEHPEQFPWSSARAHAGNTEDGIIEKSPLTEEVRDWVSFINHVDHEETIMRLKRSLATGRPIGDEAFIKRLENMTGRQLTKRKPGRKASGDSPGGIQVPLPN